MSSYFSNFKVDRYRFGDKEQPVLFQKLSTYVGVLDRVQDNIAAYTTVTVPDGERPDTLSYRIYGDTKYYWTFFLMNENVREQGWPLSQKRAYEKSEELYDGFVCKPSYADIPEFQTLMTTLSTTYPEGQNVQVFKSSVWTDAVVKYKNIQNAEIYLSSNTNLSGTDTVTKIRHADTTNELDLSAFDFEYNGTHHYIKSNENFEYDLIDEEGSLASITPVTFRENFINVNEELSVIKIIKQSAVTQIVGEFNRLVSK